MVAKKNHQSRWHSSNYVPSDTAQNDAEIKVAQDTVVHEAQPLNAHQRAAFGFYGLPREAKPVAYDTRIDGTDFRVCPKCASKRKFGGAELDPIFGIKQGDQAFCEECDKVLG